MHRGLVLVACFALALSAPPLSAATKRLHTIYRVDRVSASVENDRVLVVASGAVNSGGWSHARLHMKPSVSEADVLEMDFVADPPSTRRVVIEEVLPVSATLRLPLPKRALVAVSVTSQTNTITTEIRR